MKVFDSSGVWLIVRTACCIYLLFGLFCFIRRLGFAFGGSYLTLTIFVLPRFAAILLVSDPPLADVLLLLVCLSSLFRWTS